MDKLEELIEMGKVVMDIEFNIKNLENIKGIEMEEVFSPKQQIKINRGKMQLNQAKLIAMKTEIKDMKKHLAYKANEFNNCMDLKERGILFDKLPAIKEEVEIKIEEYNKLKGISTKEDARLLEENSKLKMLPEPIKQKVDITSLIKERRTKINDIAQFCYRWMNSEVE